MSPEQARALFLDQLGPNDTLARYGEKAAVAAILAAAQSATSSPQPVVWRWRFKDSAIKGDFWKYTDEWPLKGEPKTIDWERCEKVVEPLFATAPKAVSL